MLRQKPKNATTYQRRLSDGSIHADLSKSRRAALSFVTATLIALLPLMPIHAGPLIYTQGVNNPNAQTLPEKTFGFSFMAYNNGGLLSKVFVSIFDPFDIGVSLNIRRAIGDNRASVDIPGAYAKLRLTEGSDRFPIFVSVGYDSFFTDERASSASTGTKTRIIEDAQYIYEEEQPLSRHLDKVFYGPFAVLTKPIYLFDFEQYVHFGARMPVQPDYLPQDTAFFAGFDIPIRDNLILQSEIDRIYPDARRLSQVLYNFGIQFSIVEEFRLSLLVMTGKNRNPNRVLNIQYYNHF